MNKLHILILENSTGITDGLNGFLLGSEFHVHTAINAGEAFSILEDNVIDIALVELTRHGEFSANFMRMMKARYPELETLVIDENRELLKSHTVFFHQDFQNNPITYTMAGSAKIHRKL